MRKSGIGTIGDLPWGAHFCQFYRTKEDLTELLIPYFKAGLESNEFCVWITAYPLDAEEAKEALKKAIPDFDTYLETGQIEIIPYTYWYVKEGILDSERALSSWVEKLSQAQENGYEGVRFSWNTSWLKKEDWENFIDYERKANAVISNYHIITLCAYSLDAHNVTETIDIAANHQFSLVKKERKWEQVGNSWRKNLNGHKKAEETRSPNEQSIRLKPETTLLPDREVANLDFADIIDANAIQSLIDDFYNFAHIGMALVDLKGNILASVGWQDICAKFHRAHPETCKRCIESDTKLSSGIPPGELKLYRCKNNMWDIATPIIIGGQHVGNIFSGQFFFDNEPLDYEFFQAQSRKYGFNEEEYVAALEKVPRLSREVVDTSMAFFTSFANMISQLSYNNIKLSQSLAERDVVVDALRESEKRERARSDELAAVLDAAPVAVFIARDSQALQITGNRLSYEWVHVPEGTNFSKSAPEGERPEMFKLFKDGVELQPEDMPSQMAAAGIEVNDCELDIVSADGEVRHVLGNARPLRDEQGHLSGSVSAFIDITERKKAEEILAFERSQLLSIFEGMDDMVYVTDPYTYEVLYANNAMKEKFDSGLVGGVCYKEFQQKKYPCDFCTNQIIFKKKGKPYHWEYYNLSVDRHFMIMDRIIKWPDGRDVRFEIATDITERKHTEEALRLSNLYNRSLIEASLDPLVTIGPDGKITDVNCATEQVTGYSRNDLIGTDFSDYFTEPENARKGYKQVFTDGKVQDYPLEIQHKDGHVTPVLYNASVYRDESGKVIGVFAAARDITERKKAEETVKKAYDNLEEKVKERTAELEEAYNSLKESEKSLAEAQKIAHIGNWDNNLVIGELHWSDEMYRIFGINPLESITYDKFLSYVHPHDREYVYNSTKEAFNGKTFSTEYRIVRPDGEERIVHSEREVIFDEMNNPVRMRGTVQDITERKKSEEKIRSLANIVESSNDAIGTMSLDNVITSWNEEAEQVYGYSAEEVLGEHISLLAPPHLGNETSKLSEMIKQGKKISRHETTRLRKDGKIIDVSITLSPVFDSHGKLTAISFISRDVTERKKVEEKLRESEEKYRNIVETANEGIWILDAEGMTTYVNEKMVEILGYSQEEIIGRSVLDFACEEGKTDLKLNLERRRKGVNESHELKLTRKDGSSSWVLVNAKSLIDKDGKFIGSMGMLTDITKRRKAEEALVNIETARKQEIHHRIKNNLQVISSLLDLQAEKFNSREDIKDSEVLAAFRESQDRVMSIALIHEELHEGGGDNTLNFSPYLEKLVENLFQTYNLGNADISLKTYLEKDIFFDMDIAVPLGIIVNELVSNSLKYAFPDRKRGEIRIKLFKEEKTGNFLSNSEKEITGKGTSYTLIISDNGAGIPEKICLENSDTLGLQLVNILVDQLDGEIELKRGRGTEFRIRIKV